MMPKTLALEDDGDCNAVYRRAISPFNMAARFKHLTPMPDNRFKTDQNLTDEEGESLVHDPEKFERVLEAEIMKLKLEIKEEKEVLQILEKYLI